MSTLTLALDKLPPSGRIVVGLSGGLDSSVLLHLLAQIPALKSRLSALHIRHGLSPNADSWELHCREFCQRLAVPFSSIQVDVSRQQASLELAAREARYLAFSAHLTAQEILVTAHHQNDQAETFFLRLMRGSGLDGLTAMQEWASFDHFAIWRPLLGYSRQQLEAYAIQHALKWIEDESNQNNEFDRNYLRNQLMPILQKRWPQAINSISRATENLQESQQLLQEIANDELTRFAVGKKLNWEGLASYSLEKKKLIMRAWLKLNSIKAPSSAQLTSLIDMMSSEKKDAMPLFEFAAYEVRRFQNTLYLRDKTAMSSDVNIKNLNLNINDALPLGKLTISETKQGARLDSAKIKADLLTIRFRRGGERLKLPGQAHSKDLKNLLQAAAIPPWIRPQLPLIYLGDELVCIPGIGVAHGWQGEDNQSGWQIQWDQL